MLCSVKDWLVNCVTLPFLFLSLVSIFISVTTGNIIFIGFFLSLDIIQLNRKVKLVKIVVWRYYGSEFGHLLKRVTLWVFSNCSSGNW